MEQEHKNKGLKRVLVDKRQVELPSNFTYQTMMKLDEHLRLEEKKRDQRQCCLVIALFCILAAGTFWAMHQFFGFTFNLRPIEIPVFQKSSLFFAVILLILFGFDYSIRSIYRKRHP